MYIIHKRKSDYVIILFYPINQNNNFIRLITISVITLIDAYCIHDSECINFWSKNFVLYYHLWCQIFISLCIILITFITVVKEKLPVWFLQTTLMETPVAEPTSTLKSSMSALHHKWTCWWTHKKLETIKSFGLNFFHFLFKFINFFFFEHFEEIMFSS